MGKGVPRPHLRAAHGRVLNVSNIARDAGVSRTTVQGYLDIPNDTLLTCRVPAFEAELRERALPKLHWIDPDVVRAAPRSPGPPSSEERGATSSRATSSPFCAPQQRSGTVRRRVLLGVERSLASRGGLRSEARS